MPPYLKRRNSLNHDLCQITLDNKTGDQSEQVPWSDPLNPQRPGRQHDNYLKENRLYKVYHDKHYDGIGPTAEDSGLPLALKTTVDKPKDWYKSMFKEMHKARVENCMSDSIFRKNGDFATKFRCLTKILIF